MSLFYPILRRDVLRVQCRHIAPYIHRRSLRLSKICLQEAEAKPREELKAASPLPEQSKATSTTEAASEKPKRKYSDPTELPLLNRPLGVRERPTIFAKPRLERLKDMMKHENVIAERKHLIKEASKGYFHDMNMTRRYGGKTWIAPRVLIREDKSLYFPNVAGKSLDNGEIKNTTTMCFGRITVLAMLGTKISEDHAQSFARPTNLRYATNPLYQYVQINLQENLLKSILVNLFISSLRTVVSPPLQPSYLVSSQNMEYLREPIGMTNSKVGYVYLIDENLKVRWAGCADALPEETKALENCTGVLLKRLEERIGKGNMPKSLDEVALGSDKTEQTHATQTSTS